jgi:hypothetical protein
MEVVMVVVEVEGGGYGGFVVVMEVRGGGKSLLKMKIVVVGVC